ncbi:redoxin domain-containing protein [Crocosphaera sp. UHCC 0190]|uniref:peroxiredoxin family protein n=1 Tax=Crocosphaera sp. UHCC 0190 TaxID=3110246 RepID=UPI002B216AA8|nr:redoxin domain-containing protein [Crocosphaera sp. UHCC 0190]MEA5508826.1 redoxin domain-containing protein [Crocosphaera sp. UHCC 0190]
MVTSTDFTGLLSPRFFQNFLPIPPTNKLSLGSIAPDFILPDITNNCTLKLSDHFNQKPVILAFTRIFTEKQYCPFCYPHIISLNRYYEKFLERGIEVLMITSTDVKQSQIVVQDLGLKMPLLSNPDCRVFRMYQTGQALGAPLPAQFVLDKTGKIQYKHLFSFLDHNASVDKLLLKIS